MKFSRSVFRNLAFVTIILALVTLGKTASGQTQMPAPQAAAQASPPAVPAQAPSICGGQPFCYETADFAAVVTDFRTSKSGYFGLIATTLRFVNKTSNPLVLGYANGSGTAQDDSGLRYGVGGANGVRGMGLVNGPYVDPKFVLQPGGFGDARFELATRLTPVYGITFELNLTVNEVNTLEGNQHTVGSEFPLQFQGLTNGVKGTAPGAVMPGANGTMASGASGMLAGASRGMAGGAAPACGPASTATALAGVTNSTAAQNAAATANTAVSNAAAAFSSLGSIFGKKKQAAAAAPAQGATAAAVPCVPGANGTAGAVSNAAGTVGGAVPQGKGGASSAAAIASGVAGAANLVSGTAAAPQAGGVGAPAGVTPAGVAGAAATHAAVGTATATAPPTATAPAASTAKAKAQPAKPAVKKGAAPTPEQKKTAENADAQKAPQQ